eukprot:4590162-Pleurochrysis_carterae.AAC.1
MSGLLHLTDVDFDDDDERHALLTKPSEPMIATAIELLGCPDALEKLTHQGVCAVGDGRGEGVCNAGVEGLGAFGFKKAGVKSRFLPSVLDLADGRKALH